MAEELKPHSSPDDPYIRGSLDHTADLIKSARALLEKDLPHLAYHLALLALEEIGKLEVVLVGRVGDADDEAMFRKRFLDDHDGKIFWAFWVPPSAASSSTSDRSTGTRISRSSSTKNA